MIIIGEKINGAIPAVKEAIEKRDRAYIEQLAILQMEAGATYLDLCAGTDPEKEVESLFWLLEVAQQAVDTPLCVDSPDPKVLAQVLPSVKQPGVLNSVSGEGEKCEILYPLVADSDWKIIALTCDNQGIPVLAKEKVRIAVDLIEKAKQYGISPERIYVDPLVLSLSAVNDAVISFLEAVRSLKLYEPSVHITSGLSNISYGMPYRKIVNQNFLTLAQMAGMDSAILDPTDRELYAGILATEALLGRDPHCRNYYKAYRAGKIGRKK